MNRPTNGAPKNFAKFLAKSFDGFWLPRVRALVLPFGGIPPHTGRHDLPQPWTLTA